MKTGTGLNKSSYPLYGCIPKIFPSLYDVLGNKILPELTMVCSKDFQDLTTCQHWMLGMERKNAYFLLDYRGGEHLGDKAVV